MKDNNPHIDDTSYPEELNYSDSNWQQALDLIESHERAVRSKRILWGMSVLGIAVIALIGYFQLDQQNNNVIATNTRVEQNLNANINENIPKQNSTNETKQVGTTIEKAESNSPIDVVKNDDISKHIVDNELPIVTQSKLEAIAKQSQDNSRLNGDIDVEDNSTSNTNDLDVNKTVQSIGLQENVGPVELHSDEVASEIVEASKVADSQRSKVYEADRDNFVSLEGSKDSDGDNMEIVTPSKDKEMSSITNKIEGEEQNTSDHSKYSLMTPNSINNVPNSIKKEMKSLGVSKVPEMITQKVFRVPSDMISLRVGASPYVQYGKSKNWSGWNMSYGIMYEKRMSGNFSASLGIDYFLISSIPIVLESTATSYAYGFERIVTSVETNRMEFVSLPIMGSYRLLPRFQLSAGAGLSYLVKADNTLSKTKVTNTDTDELSREDVTGYIQGFNRLTWFTQFSGDYWITERISAGISYQLGMSDFTIDDEFKDKTIHNNSKVVFSLKRIIR